MLPDDWHEVRRVFETAFEQPSEERAAYLDRECGASGVREQVERLLESHGQLGDFLFTPEPDLPGLDGSPTAPGARIGQFTLEAPLAEGGMGAVWLAVQENPRRRVALKLMQTRVAAPDMLRRFQYEAEVLARMHHPGIAQIYEAGLHGDLPWFAMELVEDASDLVSYVRSHELDLRARLELIAKVCEAVHYGHQNGVIHRDLKPGNLLVDGSGQVKVIDFGVARAADEEPSARMTRAGDLVGTLHYMSPEQLDGDQNQIDTRTDVYALGVVLYELLSGRPPYVLDGLPLTAIARVVRDLQPKRPSTFQPKISRELDWIALKALEKEPTRRYLYASDLSDDIRRFLAHEPVLAGPPSATYRLRKFVRRHRVTVAAAFLMLLSLVLGLIHAVFQRRVAEAEAAKANAVASFMIDLFAAPDPSQLGREVKVVDVLKQAEGRAHEALGRFPAVESLLRHTLGSLYHNLGLPEEAEQSFLRALELRRQEHGQEHPEILETLSALGLVQMQLGRIEPSERALTEALELANSIVGEDHEQSAKILNSLAMLRHRQTRFDEAERLYRRVIELNRRGGRSTELNSLTSKTNLGSLLLERGRLEEAEQVLEPALEQLRNSVGSLHRQTIHAIRALASLRILQERHSEARELFDEALLEMQRSLPPEHPDLLDTLNNLAVLYYAMSDFETAERLMREAIAAHQKVHGPREATTVLQLCNLAGILLIRGNRTEMNQVLEQVLELHLGEFAEDMRAVQPFKKLGFSLREGGEPEFADRLWSELLEAQRRLLPDDNPERVETERLLNELDRAR